MRYIKILMLFVALAAWWAMGCHGGGESTSSGEIDGGSDGGTDSASVFTSVEASDYGRAIEITFSAPVPEASESLKADALSRAGVEAELVLEAGGEPIAPLSFYWPDATSVRVSGAIPSCAQLNVQLGEDSAAVTAKPNQSDYDRSELCDADFPMILPAGEVTDLLVLTGSQLISNRGFNVYHALLEEGYELRASDMPLWEETVYILRNSDSEGRVAYTSGTNKTDPNQKWVMWSEFGADAAYDATVAAVTSSAMKPGGWFDIGDVDRDGINDSALVGKESTTGKDLITHLYIVPGGTDIAVSSPLEGAYKYYAKVGISEAEAGMPVGADLRVDRGPPGDIDGDGYADLPILSTAEPATGGSLEEIQIYSGEDVIAGDMSSPIYRIRQDRVGKELVGRIAAADMNCDGVRDLIATISRIDPITGNSIDNNLLVFFGGAGFSAERFSDADVTISSDDEIEDLRVIGDFNGDGCDDLIAMLLDDSWTHRGGIILGARDIADGSFDDMSAAEITSGPSYYDIAITRETSIGDYDNDGYDDLGFVCYHPDYYRTQVIIRGRRALSDFSCGMASASVDVCGCGGAISPTEQVMFPGSGCESALNNFINSGGTLSCGLSELVEHSGMTAADALQGVSKQYAVNSAEVDAWLASPTGQTFKDEYLMGSDDFENAVLDSASDSNLSTREIVNYSPLSALSFSAPMPNCAYELGICPGAGQDMCSSVLGALVYLPACVQALSVP